ncbi:MAG: type III pantothenate kinase [Bacteroidales bacterium]|nr:type III pantothenate kinase [Bacteroidales bacterium]
MNLAIDFGNTCMKLGLFNDNILTEVKVFERNKLKELEKYVLKKNIKSIIISSVIRESEAFIKTFIKRNKIIKLENKTKLPIKNLYKTTKTLGKDRIADVVGANFIFPEKNVLVIDIGTCIKYDFINSKNEYLGGSISPGVEMRLKALHNYTDKLPLIKRREINNLIGNTTETSILSGVLNGISAEIDGIIEKYKIKFKDLKVILTGGDIIFFDNRIKNSTFAEPNLVLKGLNVILRYNQC